jgi:hypothetical protein
MALSEQEQLLIASVAINVLLVVERFLKRIKKSSCCGSEIELGTPTVTVESVQINSDKNI